MPATSLQSAYRGFSITVAMIRQLISGYSSRAVSSLKAPSIKVMSNTSVHPNIPPPRRTLRDNEQWGMSPPQKNIGACGNSTFLSIFRRVCANFAHRKGVLLVMLCCRASRYYIKHSVLAGLSFQRRRESCGSK